MLLYVVYAAPCAFVECERFVMRASKELSEQRIGERGSRRPPHPFLRALAFVDLVVAFTDLKQGK
jgi:hypothetical protein